MPASPPTLPPVDGLKSEPLRRALAAALAGKPADLETWLCRYGLGAEPRPNLKLAAALAAELCAAPGAPRLLARFAANDAAPDTPEVFLPIAAAYGWAARIAAGKRRARRLARARRARGRRARHRCAWERARRCWRTRCGPTVAPSCCRPRRTGCSTTIASFATARPASCSTCWATAGSWHRSERREPLLEYLTSVIDEIAGAPRSAERSDARRRLLLALPAACGAAVVALRGGDLGASWLEAECMRARQPDVRSALSNAILGLRHLAPGPSAETIQRLRHALEGSAKPLRDPTRLRPGTGRGRDSRRMK